VTGSFILEMSGNRVNPSPSASNKLTEITETMENSNEVLSIRNVSKTYANGVQALHNVTLHIPPGMYGLLGPNGAGKSTLMRTLATLQEPDEGTITLGNLDVLNQKEEVRQSLGYLPQEFGVYPKVSAEELLDYFAVLKGITNRASRKEVIESLLRQTNLWDKRRQKLGGFSGGMKQRFGVAVALLGNPKLLIVDEPTAGLDPEERVRFLNLLSEIGENSVVILSTHIVEDVSELCTNMAIINKGKILLEAQPLQAVASLKGKIWGKLIDKHTLASLQAEYNIISAKLLSGRTLVHVYSPENPGYGFELVEPDLEDVYFSTMTGHYATAYQKPEVEEVNA
jgi:ABC-type multidrug transport system ATPase subunit